ncbi:unnamed protein product [Pleuronectes platessa]|uniref:Uncharacterized protein n=1 Tax=Pleuronectes platessa TaxID=8262 RepID=A0A9N7Z5N7_PLEPL|nr:unnamed protein product [Pleuronectes platessa]
MRASLTQRYCGGAKPHFLMIGTGPVFTSSPLAPPTPLSPSPPASLVITLGHRPVFDRIIIIPTTSSVDDHRFETAAALDEHISAAPSETVHPAEIKEEVEKKAPCLQNQFAPAACGHKDVLVFGPWGLHQDGCRPDFLAQLPIDIHRQRRDGTILIAEFVP